MGGMERKRNQEGDEKKAEEMGTTKKGVPNGTSFFMMVAIQSHRNARPHHIVV